MAETTRQTTLFGVEDWKKIYQTFREADFQSYDFETLRKSFVDYLRLYYPETFNDYIESSEFIALLDLMAFMGQSLAFRNDLNARENYIDTAERRDSVVRLANLVSYTPKRNTASQGYLKVQSISTTENITDFNGLNLSNITVDWNDATNVDWLDQFNYIINAALVNSQKIGRPGNTSTILGVKTDEYTVNLTEGFLPIVPFTAIVDGINMPFEAVSATSVGKTYIYEPSPKPNGQFNVLYRNDGLGYSSANTGFFFYFKQGSLQNQDFNLVEALPNRTVNINIEGCNNDDHWLYKLNSNGTIDTEWEYSENIYSAAVEQLAPNQRNIYGITSRSNDQITLTFGDGVFAEAPVGQFRSYVRSSNGLKYIINPEEMQSKQIQLQYISRNGRLETLTMVCSLESPVSNSLARESIPEIKQRAPARYYTQNRMVNGEDYNNFPFTKYNSIIKSKAVARSSIGTSRYVDLTDVTNKYSSTNIFASDGALWRQNILPTFNFFWSSRNDIVDTINNSVTPLLSTRTLTQFYYQNFVRPQLGTLGIAWNQSTTSTNQTTGYFYNSTSSTPVPIGVYSGSNAKYLKNSSLVKFSAPSGYFFDRYNRLKAGVPTKANEKLYIWATVTSVTLDGTNQGEGNFANGSGPVTLNNFVPTGAIPQEVIPVLLNDLPSSLVQSMIDQISLYRDFGLGYNNLSGEWYLITSTNLAQDATFSLSNAQDTSGTNQDASWLMQFITDGENYTVSRRGLQYTFGSVIETRFFFSGDGEVYDSRTGSIINDFVNVLKSNSQADTNTSLPNDIKMDIIAQAVQSDGYVNDYEVEVSYTDSDGDGVADNPDFFTEIVNPTVNPTEKYVFLQTQIDYDNLERYMLLDAGEINISYASLTSIEVNKSQYANGQKFYAYSENKFYQLTVTLVNGVFVRTINEITGIVAVVGRQDLAFQYRHNSALTNVINPGSTNIIDIYVVTNQYYNSYTNYIRDITGTIKQPTAPTISELELEYSDLADYKMVSDNIVLNSVEFKPLFGNKADPELRAKIKVVQADNSTVSISEIKSKIISYVNQYFSIENWDFGDSFFFSELSAYLHKQMGSDVSSVVLVPVNPLKTFGDLYEVRSEPNEIFVSAATVNDVEVVSALTASTLQSSTTEDGLY